MEKHQDNYCVILAGGEGKRLWPSSRRDKPKQFIDFFGTGRTLLQTTYDRVSKFILEDHIYVCTRSNYKHWVNDQLPQVNDDNILIEPVNRNTAPSVAWAGRRIHRQSDNARIIVVPSDQLIIGEEAFCENVITGLDFVAQNDIMLTMGVMPTRPEPGYGYIQMGEATITKGISKVQSFTEKPEREFATLFMESREFLWNTGIFMTNVRHMRQFFLKIFTELPVRLADLRVDYTPEEEYQCVQQSFPLYPNVSMDKAALEMYDNVYVAQCDFGWADIGTWHACYEYMQKGDDDNVVIDSEVMMEECHGNIVKLPKGHIGVINGLDGYIIAEEGDVLLICKKYDSSALIRKYVNEVGIKYGDLYV